MAYHKTTFFGHHSRQQTVLQIQTRLSFISTNYTVQVAGGNKPYTGLKNKTGETLNVGDSVIIKAINGNAGNGYIGVKMGD